MNHGVMNLVIAGYRSVRTNVRPEAARRLCEQEAQSGEHCQKQAQNHNSSTYRALDVPEEVAKIAEAPTRRRDALYHRVGRLTNH